MWNRLMIKSKPGISISIILTVFTLFLGYGGTANAGSAGPYASGHGNLITEGKLRTFTFHARELNNGRVVGSLVLKNRGLGARAKAKIDCLDINGNQATMSGVITQVRGADQSLIGDEVWFRVEDNGEGFRNTTDRITLVLVEEDTPPDPDECTVNLGLDLQNIRAGDIQVNP